MAAVSCFKAYDIRGRVPEEINPDVARAIAAAYVSFLRPRAVVVGRDVRLSSEPVARGLMEGFTTAGCDVLDLGVCGTEQVYFSTAHLGADGGVMVTASHNPKDYNGMKLVREGARPISGDSGLRDIEEMVAEILSHDRYMSCPARPAPAPGDAASRRAQPAGEARAATGLPEVQVAGRRGSVRQVDTTRAYAEHVLGYVDAAALHRFKVVADPGNGCAGPVLDVLAPRLPFKMVWVRREPDGTFPHGTPNPLLPENRALTARAVVEHGADVGIAWDGDFDRCFLFDEKGEFVEGYYLVGFLAGAMLRREGRAGDAVIHDPRLTWNTIEMVEEAGGRPVMCKTGHAFIKERMRSEDALYGGEMSAHHYFRRFYYCDSGMIPWILLLSIMSESGTPLSELVRDRAERFPVSGEINRQVADPDGVMRAVEEEFASKADAVDYTDGLSVEAARWRFNLRKSNTEPLIRLNVETRGDRELLGEITRAVLELVERTPR